MSWVVLLQARTAILRQRTATKSSNLSASAQRGQHIHIGAEGIAGPVVQGLTAPTDGHSSGCVVNDALADALAADPGNYYVNVHNAEYPAGAVRGQLD